MRHYISIIATLAVFAANAQQINPVPDYVFRNQMSVGRNAVTDTAAYFSIGPRYGAVKGMMPPMVIDTASMSATKRNGLLIFSIQKNKYLYWDSVGAKWAEMAGTAGSAITGSGVAGYMPEFTTSTNLDTTRLYHSAGRFGIGTTSPLTGLHVNDEVMASKLVVDTIGGLAYNSPWRTSGVRTNFTGVTHWWGKTEGAGASPTGGGDFTFFKSRRGDSAMLSGEEIWYNEYRAKYRNNHSSWSTNDSSRVAQYEVEYAQHINGTPSARHLFRSKNSSGSFTDYIDIDPLNDEVNINGTQLDVQKNIIARDNATIQDTLKIGTVDAVKSNTVGPGQIQIATNNVTAFNMSTYNSADPTNASYFAFVRARGTAASPAVVQSGDVLGALAFDGYNNPSSSFPSVAAAQIRAVAAETFTSTSAAGSIQFLTTNTGSINATERMRINPAGEVQIGSGTDLGAYTLQVSGNIYNTLDAFLAAGGAEVYLGTTTDNGNFRLQVNGNAYVSGNVGIGTTSPSQALHVNGGFRISNYLYGSANTILLGQDGSGGSNMYLGDVSNDITGSRLFIYAKDRISFHNNGVENVRIRSDGEVLIGSTTDAGAYKLQVTGEAIITAGIRTDAPSGGTAATWKLGTVATVSPTSPNRTIEVEIGGTTYYIHAKTTNN